MIPIYILGCEVLMGTRNTYAWCCFLHVINAALRKPLLYLRLHLSCDSCDVYCEAVWVSSGTLVYHFWLDGWRRPSDVDIFGGDCCKEALPCR